MDFTQTTENQNTKKMKDWKDWKNKLRQADGILSSWNYPIWWDGFRNVVLRGESSDLSDNPYFPEEQPHHDQYKAGAIAGESLLANV